MNYKVIWTVTAANDLNEIIDYIAAKGDYVNAEKIFRKIKSKTEFLIVSPEQGRFIPELKIFNNIKYREIIIKPWRVIYKIEKSFVYILMIIDGRRNLDDILFDQLINNNTMN